MRSRTQLLKMILAAVKPARKMSVSEWADTFRILPSTSAEPGKWKSSRIPYMTEVMDAFTTPQIRRVAVKSAAQVGKSEVLLNVVGRYAQLDPANIMILQPTLEMAQDFSKSRLEKMIQDTPSLTPLFYDLQKTRNANQTILSKYYTGGRIVLAGANSPAGLASRPIRILLADEVDRFPAAAGKEGDPLEIAAKRTTTYFNAKIGIFSTPTQEGASRIDVEYLLGTQEQWCHECPNCGEFHFLDYREMVTDFEERIDEYKNKIVVVNSVKWRCPDCGGEFSEAEIKAAPQKYICKNPDAIKNGVRSFWVNGFSSPWVSWRLIMKERLEAAGDASREAVVANTRFGVSYRPVGEFADENVFLKRREKYACELPEGVLLLTSGVDVQHNRLEYLIAGWGADETFYGIRRGTVWGSPTKISTWEKLDEILNREYKYADGRALKVARTFIDSGYSTENVYRYCESRQVSGKFPIKGLGGAGLPILHQFGRPKNAAVILSILGVDTLKSEVMARLAIEPPKPKCFRFPLDDENFERGFDEIFFKELIAEHLVARKKGGNVYLAWEPTAQGARNESLDISGYALAAMKSCIGNRVDFWESLADSLNVKKAAPTAARAIKSRQIDIY